MTILYRYYAPHFDVFTDFKLLIYRKTSYKLNAADQRWVNEPTDYKFSIHYSPGTENTVADALSRYPLDIQESQKVCQEKSNEIWVSFNQDKSLQTSVH